MDYMIDLAMVVAPPTFSFTIFASLIITIAAGGAIFFFLTHRWTNDRRRAALAMATSPVRGLLPPDVGMLVHGPYVTLDFSRRPFDTIEFERMLVVMEQLVTHLPAQAEAPAM